MTDKEKAQTFISIIVCLLGPLVIALILAAIWVWLPWWLLWLLLIPVFWGGMYGILALFKRGVN